VIRSSLVSVACRILEQDEGLHVIGEQQQLLDSRFDSIIPPSAACDVYKLFLGPLVFGSALYSADISSSLQPLIMNSKCMLDWAMLFLSRKLLLIQRRCEVLGFHDYVQLVAALYDPRSS
jgi:hypothetical protein